MESTDDQAASPNDETILVEALELLRELDDTPLGQMNALFYQHGFEELNLTVRALLRILGRDPGE
ncbi:hypothetical protein [[Micrococcus luteus] ATCC 49442]|uniref:hypothetical protein n=1 Tax=[Micrococcus luteus] ATCC 49442 TaxID=2698727 RepID=UPI0013DCAB7C|nr:hypothetical protein [[Micrococcus luteus] ATCC 49442]